MWKESHGLRWLEIDSFNATGLVNHGFSTRLGGVSTGEYTSLNLGLHVGDDAGSVAENRSHLVHVLGLAPDHVLHGDQVHQDRVVRVNEGHRGQSAVGDLAETDALCTNVPGLALMVLTADCVPILFLDPIQRAVATCHAGWKGTVAKIAQKTVTALVREFGSDPENILVAIGPSIGPCCYPVGANVAAAVQENCSSWWDQTLVRQGDRWTFDLWNANRLQLQDAGIRRDHIEVTGLCTSCNVGIFYSFRAEQGHTGRMAGVIALR